MRNLVPTALSLMCLVLCFAGCSKDGQLLPDPSLDMSGQKDLGDALRSGDIAVDGIQDDRAQGDRTGPEVNRFYDSRLTDGGDAGLQDSQGELNHDGWIPDGPADGMATGDIFAETVQPFEPCSQGTGCKNPDQPLCLLLPDSEEGVCVKPCAEGQGQCPPWLDCIQPDPGNPQLKICMEQSGAGEPCSAADGVICESGLFCVQDLVGNPPQCTSFCNIGEAVCPKGTDCTPIDPEDPEPDWGACLPVPDLPSCLASGDCQETEACVEAVTGYFKCVLSCAEPGLPCAVYGSCVPLLQPDEEQANACIIYQGPGEICSPEKGLLCEDGLTCADVGAPDAWNRCLQSCTWGPCLSGYACKELPGQVDKLCVPVELAGDGLVACNPDYPCPEPVQACVPIPGQINGLCATSCEAGCTALETCYEGGCLPVVPPGSACLETAGVVCAPPSQCVRDPGADGPGWCAVPCDESPENCPEPTKCVVSAGGGSVCLDAVGYAELCSLDDGIGCDPDLGLSCIHLFNEEDFGFCTKSCTGPGTCDMELPGTYPECMIQKAGTWYCAMICGAMGAKCPDWLSCSGLGMCLP